MNNNIKQIIRKFAKSGWNLLEVPAKEYLNNLNDNKHLENLITAVKMANQECGNCGCEYDILYQQFLEYFA